MTASGRESIVKELLACADEKVIRGYPGNGLAHRLERHVEDAQHPWASIAAYRLAHLRMRTATTDDLLDVDELFRKASRTKGLGPWPSLFRLAVLHRLGEPSMFSVPFERALELATEPIEHDPTLQNTALNVLELCTYAFGLPYDERLATTGVLPFGPRRRGTPGWFLVSKGVDGLPTESRYSLATHALAREELDELGQRFPAAVLFELPALGAHQRDDGRVWRDGTAVVESCQDGLRALARRHWPGVVTFDEETADNTWNQRLHRLRLRATDMGPLDDTLIGIIEEGARAGTRERDQ